MFLGCSSPGRVVFSLVSRQLCACNWAQPCLCWWAVRQDGGLYAWQRTLLVFLLGVYPNTCEGRALGPKESPSYWALEVLFCINVQSGWSVVHKKALRQLGDEKDASLDFYLNVPTSTPQDLQGGDGIFYVGGWLHTCLYSSLSIVYVWLFWGHMW